MIIINVQLLLVIRVQIRTLQNKNDQENNIKKKIMVFLESSEHGDTSAKIAKDLGFSRITVKKYLSELVQENKIIQHKIGPYIIYEVREPIAIQKMGIINVYTKLIENLNFYTTFFPGEDFNQNLKNVGKEISKNILLTSFEKFTIDLRWLKPSIIELRNLISVIPKIFEFFAISNNSNLLHEVEFNSTYNLDNSDKRNDDVLFLSLIDEDIFLKHAEFHYYIVAGIIEDVLSKLTRIPICFNLRKLDLPNSTLFFELGFMDAIFMEYSVLQINENSRTPIQILEQLKNFWKIYYQFKFEEYTDKNDILYYRFTFPDNRLLEQKTRLNIANYQFFLQNIQNYQEKSSKINSIIPSKPFFEWKKDACLIIKGKTNSKLIGLSLMPITELYYQEFDVFFHNENNKDHYLFYFRTWEDFDIITTPKHEPQKEYQFFERRLGKISPEYFKKRNEVIGQISEFYSLKKLS